MSSTTSTGGSSGTGWRTSNTRRVVWPSGIVSPGSHFGATVWNDGGSAGAPSTVTSLNVSVLAIGLLSAGTGRPDRAYRGGRSGSTHHWGPFCSPLASRETHAGKQKAPVSGGFTWSG